MDWYYIYVIYLIFIYGTNVMLMINCGLPAGGSHDAMQSEGLRALEVPGTAGGTPYNLLQNNDPWVEFVPATDLYI